MSEEVNSVTVSAATPERRRSRGRKSELTPVERAVARRKHQRDHYLKNREKARLYQREYNLLHRKKKRFETNEKGCPLGRQTVKSVFTIRDIMSSSPEQPARMLEMILGGKRSLTM